MMDMQIIKEMAEDIDFACVDLSKDTRLEVARALTVLNYRKIPENSVVLTKEEYGKIKHVLKYEPEEAIIRLEDLTKNERLYNPHMFCSLGGCSGVHKGCNHTCKESWIVIERKETAKEILQTIMDIIKKSDCFLSPEVVRILAKNSGVEVEE